MKNGQNVPIFFEDAVMIDPVTKNPIPTDFIKFVWVDGKYALPISGIDGVSQFLYVDNISSNYYKLIIDRRFDPQYVINEIESLVMIEED